MRDIYGTIRSASLSGEPFDAAAARPPAFATFEDGYHAACIVDAVLASHRGGAVWTFDMKSGQMGWKWLVEPKAATPRQKRVTVPSSEVDVRSERL